MEPKHTPGPWEVNGSGAYEICDLDIITITADHDIADDGPERVEADARLISAAPDLLAALEWITRCAKMSGPAGTTVYFIAPDRMESAKAAVLKAKGVTA